MKPQIKRWAADSSLIPHPSSLLVTRRDLLRRAGKAIVNLQKLVRSVPVGDYVDLYFEYQSPGDFLSPTEKMTEIVWDVSVPTAEMTMWILMPEGMEYRGFRVNRYQTGQPEKVEPVKVVTEYLADDYTILAYKLQPLKNGYTYQVTWYYK